MAINVPSFNTINVAGAHGAAEQVKGQKLRNALMGHQNEALETAKKNRQQMHAMRQLTDNAGEAIQQLEADGNYDAAEQLRTTMQGQFKNTMEILEGAKGWVDESNYKQVRSELLQQGVIDPDDMPVDFDGSFFDRKLQEVKNKLNKITLNTPGQEPGQVMSEDFLFDEYGRQRARGGQYEDPGNRNKREGRGADGKPWEMDASDTNSVGRSVGEFLGATYSPITGTFSGLNREQAQQAQTIKEEASRIYREHGGQLSHEEAVSQAIRQFGVDVRSLQDERSNDPLGIRNALKPQ